MHIPKPGTAPPKAWHRTPQSLALHPPPQSLDAPISSCNELHERWDFPCGLRCKVGCMLCCLGLLPVAFTSGVNKFSSPGPMSVANEGCECCLIVGCIAVKH